MNVYKSHKIAIIQKDTLAQKLLYIKNTKIYNIIFAIFTIDKFIKAILYINVL